MERNGNTSGCSDRFLQRLQHDVLWSCDIIFTFFACYTCKTKFKQRCTNRERMGFLIYIKPISVMYTNGYPWGATLLTSATGPEKGAIPHSNCCVWDLYIAHQIELIRIVLFSLRGDKTWTPTTLLCKWQGRLKAICTHNNQQRRQILEAHWEAVWWRDRYASGKNVPRHRDLRSFR